MGGEIACAVPPFGRRLGITGAVSFAVDCVYPFTAFTLFHNRLQDMSIEFESFFGLDRIIKNTSLSHDFPPLTFKCSLIEN
jgi:hypothetical protein